MPSVKKSPINQRIAPIWGKKGCVFQFPQNGNVETDLPRGKIFGTVDIHFGKRDTFSQKAKCRENTYEFKYFIN